MCEMEIRSRISGIRWSGGYVKGKESFSIEWNPRFDSLYAPCNFKCHRTLPELIPVIRATILTTRRTESLCGTLCGTLTSPDCVNGI